jgi:type IV secretory pathway VirB2 component (pilin)
MNKIFPRAFTFVLFASVLALQMSPALAQFTGTGTQATTWLVQLATPFVSLAVAVVGLACLSGRVNWLWFGAAIVGCALFFGRDQVVSLFRGFVGA